MNPVNYKCETFFSLDETIVYAVNAYADSDRKHYARFALLFSSVAMGFKGIKYTASTLVVFPFAIIKLPCSIYYLLGKKGDEDELRDISKLVHKHFPGITDFGKSVLKTAYCFLNILTTPLIGFIAPEFVLHCHSVILNLKIEKPVEIDHVKPIQIKHEQPIEKEPEIDINPKEYLDDLIGMDEIKQQLDDHVLTPLKNPELAKEFGVKLENIFFHGLTGCGKTYLINALTNSIEQILGKDRVRYHLITIDITREFYVKIERQILQGLFPVIINDDIELLIGEEGEEKANISTATEGYLKWTEKKSGQALFINCSSKPLSLHSDLIKGQRLGQPIFVSPPERKTREQILTYFVEKNLPNKIDPDVDFGLLAEKTEGFTIANLKFLVEQTAKNAFLIQSKDDQITHLINQKAFEDVLKGINPEGTKEKLLKYQNKNPLLFKNVTIESSVEEFSETFENLKGMDDIKSILNNYVLNVLKSPIEAKKYGINIENILLHGLPGCGKTHIVRVLTNSIKQMLGSDKVAYHEINSATNGSQYHHQTAVNINMMFKRIEKSVIKGLFPVVFMDEIDGMIGNRDNHQTAEFSGEEIELYLKWIEKLSGKALIISGTNKPSNLDFAIVRTGRIGQKIFVGPPKLHQREEIISYYLNKLSQDILDKDIDVAKLAKITEGFSSSDLKALCERAAKTAFASSKLISMDAFVEAFKSIIPSCSDKKVIAYKKNNPDFF